MKVFNDAGSGQHHIIRPEQSGSTFCEQSLPVSAVEEAGWETFLSIDESRVPLT